jgi:hypothetical protein
MSGEAPESPQAEAPKKGVFDEWVDKIADKTITPFLEPLMHSKLEELNSKDPDALQSYLGMLGMDVESYIMEGSQLNISKLLEEITITQKIKLLLMDVFGGREGDENEFKFEVTAVSFDEFSGKMDRGEYNLDPSKWTQEGGNHFYGRPTGGSIKGLLNSSFRNPDDVEADSETPADIPFGTSLVLPGKSGGGSLGFSHFSSDFLKFRAACRSLGKKAELLVPGEEIPSPPDLNTCYVLYAFALPDAEKEAEDYALEKEWWAEFYESSGPSIWFGGKSIRNELANNPLEEDVEEEEPAEEEEAPELESADVSGVAEDEISAGESDPDSGESSSIDTEGIPLALESDVSEDEAPAEE